MSTHISCLPHEKALSHKRVAIGGRNRRYGRRRCQRLAALAAADVGISVGSSALLADGSDIALSPGPASAFARGVAGAVDVARTVRITAQRSVAIGMGVSIGQMILAAAGVVDPITSSAMQEVVDVGSLLYSLSILLFRLQN